MVLDIVLVDGHCGGLCGAQIVRRPGVHPLAHRHLLRRDIRSCVDGYCRRLHLLPDFLLCLAGERPLYLPPSARVPACSYPGLPVGVFFSLADHRLFADGACSLRCSFCHDVLLSFDTTAPLCYHKRAVWCLWLVAWVFVLLPSSMFVASAAVFSYKANGRQPKLSAIVRAESGGATPPHLQQGRRLPVPSSDSTLNMASRNFYKSMD